MGSVAKRPDGKWRARYRDPQGNERAAHFARKIDAEQWLARQVVDVQRGAWVDPRLGRQTFGGYVDEWMAMQVHWRPESRSRIDGALRNHILPAFGERRLQAITRSECQAWVADRSRRYEPRTVRFVAGVLAQVLRAAVDDGALVVSPARRLSLPTIEMDELTVLTVEQVAAITAALPDYLRAMVELAAGTGVRISEAAAVTGDRIDWLRRTLRVDRQLAVDGSGFRPTKSKASVRTIPLADVTLTALSNHLAQWPTDRLLFRTPSGLAWTRSAFSKKWRPAVKVAGLDGVRFHDLRHFYASMLINAGLSVKAVQVVLGHESATVTLNTYAKLWPSDDESTRSAVNRVLAVLEQSAESRTEPANGG